MTRVPAGPAIGGLAVLLLALAIVAVGHGAFRIAPLDVMRFLAAAVGLDFGGVDAREAAVLSALRLPRVVLALTAGAGLAVAGAIMQGLFRNPLADPALVGVSSGAALAAAFTIVLGATWMPGVTRALGAWTLPVAAFLGALAVTTIVYRIGASGGFVALPSMLLAGIALNALAMAGVGFLSFLATDEQLRNLTFWNFGSFAGATWELVAAVVPLAFAAIALGGMLAGPLDALALGETQAAHLGVDVARVKRMAVVATALSVGSLVAATGVIGFVGLVAPHAVRLACGPAHRVVLPGSALLGALLVVAADTVARTVVAPAELPIGILTAALGAPFFLALLVRRHPDGS